MPVRLAKLVVLQQEVHSLYDLLRENPSWVEHLEVYVRRLERGEHAEGAEHRKFDEETDEDEEGASMPSLLGSQQGALRRFAERRVVRRIFTLHGEGEEHVNFIGLQREELRLYFTLTQRTEPPETGGAIRRDNFIEPEMCTIPAGKFLMGSTSDEHRQREVDEDEVPQHHLALPEYRIGKYPVTNAEYQRFVSATAHPSPVNWEGQQYPEEGGDHPVTRVSWYDAIAYCRWLSEKTGRSYDLPSEAEWEKAARGGDGRKWPWGKDWDSKRANTREGGAGNTTAVGAHSPEGDSPYDVTDMAGNVWEWTRSSFQKYRKEGAETAPDSNRRMLRGGSYLSSSEYVRCAVRNREDPHHWHRDCGFRLVLPAP